MKISELEKRYSAGGYVLSLVNGTQTVSMNSETARTAVKCPQYNLDYSRTVLLTYFIERNSNPIHQILDFSNISADTTFNSAQEQAQAPNAGDDLHVLKISEIFMNVLKRRLVVDNIDQLIGLPALVPL